MAGPLIFCGVHRETDRKASAARILRTINVWSSYLALFTGSYGTQEYILMQQTNSKQDNTVADKRATLTSACEFNHLAVCRHIKKDVCVFILNSRIRSDEN